MTGALPDPRDAVSREPVGLDPAQLDPVPLDRAQLDPAGLDPAEPVAARGARRLLFGGLAVLFLTLAALGAILPGLPTTPFLLLASYFLARVSPRWNRLLLNSRFFGPILRDWQQHRGVRLDVKLQAILIVALCVTLSLWLTTPGWPLSVGLAVVALCGVCVILKLPGIS